MLAKITIEMLNDDEFIAFGVIQIGVPFARARFNFVMEAIATFTKRAGEMYVPPGIYRFGGDDAARIEWDGSRRKILKPVEPGIRDKELYRHALEASHERS